MRLFNEFTAGSDLLRIWPRTTTPNSIAAFSMIHLLYDRVDRDSALINDPVPSLPTPRRQLSLSRIREEARNRAGKEGGGRGEGRRKKDSNFSWHGTYVRTFPFYFYRAGDGEDRVLLRDRFDLDLLLPPSPRLRGIGGPFRRDIATTEFDRSLVRSDDQRIRHDACGKRG